MTAQSTTLRSIPRFIDRRTAIGYLGLAAGLLPVWPFAWHLALHVLGATMLIANAVAMGAWLTVAGRAGGLAAKRSATRAVILGDVWFTVPGAALLLANGLAMAVQRYGGLTGVASTPFIAAGVLLLAGTGIVWAFRLVPAQVELHRLAHATGPFDDRAFRSVLASWSVWGIIATVLPILAVVIMTTKPTL